VDGDPKQNLKAFEKIIRAMKEAGIAMVLLTIR
jgi:hypothetical protein